MCAWHGIATAPITLLALWISASGVNAQSFEDRWLLVPKAHADEAPPPPLILPEAPSAKPQPETPSADAADPAHAYAHDAARQPHRGRTLVGRASFYAYKKGKTASGAAFNAHGMTAAHRSLPFGTRLRVTNIKTSKSVEVVVTDRGPVSRTRVLDLSYGAAKALGMREDGVARIRAEIIRW
jgi:rare lipoprotein A (peptidoglycan hydrolase)